VKNTPDLSAKTELEKPQDSRIWMPRERAARIARLGLRLFNCKKGRWIELTPTTEASS
jgi:hypothetical protein